MKKEKIRELLSRYINGQCTEEERAWVETWYITFQSGLKSDLSDEDVEKDLHEILRSLASTERQKIRRFRLRGAAAIAFLAILSVIGYSYLKNTSAPPAAYQAQKQQNDIAPGSNKATLTLADGSSISLDDSNSGEIAEQHGLKISKTEDGRIVYTASPSSQETEESSVITYNEIKTPNGGQYEIVLPDGTKVWLNAASSLKYPVIFKGNERKVELSGEAYFEVTTINKNGLVPFIVQTSMQQIKVLGTAFNVNAYKDELSTKTTLLHGSVKIIPQIQKLNNDESILLKPGQESKLTKDKISVAAVNTAEAIAWKNGMFYFQDSDIKSVMRQLSRWYNVEVEFEGKIPDIKLWGEIHRDVNASKALKILEYFNLKYRIEKKNDAKKIIISP